MCQGLVAPSPPKANAPPPPPRGGVITPCPRFHPHLRKRAFFVASSPRPRNALYAVFWPSWHKAVAIDSDIPAPNRFLIFMYPSKEVADKVQNDTIKPWAEKVKGKYVDRYRVFGVEAVEQK
jgi:hypothetical protein